MNGSVGHLSQEKKDIEKLLGMSLTLLLKTSLALCNMNTVFKKPWKKFLKSPIFSPQGQHAQNKT